MTQLHLAWIGNAKPVADGMCHSRSAHGPRQRRPGAVAWGRVIDGREKTGRSCERQTKGWAAMAGRVWLHHRPMRSWPGSPVVRYGCIGPCVGARQAGRAQLLHVGVPADLPRPYRRTGEYRRSRERQAKGKGGDGRPAVVAWAADTAADGPMVRVTGDRVRLHGFVLPTDARGSADCSRDRWRGRSAGA